MSEVKVTATDNGPYRVEGPVELRDPEGNPIATPGSGILLCRCGGSTNKPFCDGTHTRNGFRCAIAGVRDPEQSS